MEFTNSSLVDYVKISPFKTENRRHSIDTITIHCMAQNYTVEKCGEIFSRDGRNASSNYGIDSDGRIGMYCEEKDRSWCSSNGDNDHRAITIEVANIETVEPFRISDKAYESLINLLVDICMRNEIKELKWLANKQLVGQVDKQNMTAHRWFAAKSCPGEWIYTNLGRIANDVNRNLVKLRSELNMTKEEFINSLTPEEATAIYKKICEPLKDNDAQDYSQAARDWAVKWGLIEGINEGNYAWELPITREQFITIFKRFVDKISMGE